VFIKIIPLRLLIMVQSELDHDWASTYNVKNKMCVHLHNECVLADYNNQRYKLIFLPKPFAIVLLLKSLYRSTLIIT
jgi:hypothetical protein